MLVAGGWRQDLRRQDKLILHINNLVYQRKRIHSSLIGHSKMINVPMLFSGKAAQILKAGQDYVVGSEFTVLLP